MDTFKFVATFVHYMIVTQHVVIADFAFDVLIAQ